MSVLSVLNGFLEGGGYLIVAMLVAVFFLKLVFEKTLNSASKKTGMGRYRATYHPKRLINKSEENVFNAIKTLVSSNSIDVNVFSQVSYGEFIGTKGKDSFAAFNKFNSKRADFLIADSSYNPLVVVEYHGEGHFKGANMAKSDSVKAEVCRAAGIRYLTIHYKEKNNLSGYLSRNLLPLIESHAKGF